MKRTIAATVSLLLILLCGSNAFGKVSVKGLRYWSSKQYTRVVVDLDGHAEFTQNRLSNPDRLFFDLKDSGLSKDTPRSVSIEDGILGRLRAAQYDKETVRVVLYLQETENFNVFMLKEPDRLVVDLFGHKEIKPIPGKKEEGQSVIRSIVIDPGHGGEDPGAVGPGGLKEKDVVLAIAKKVGRIIKEKYNIEVIYTRDRDVFVPLGKRSYIANSKKADLFISIHANASRKNLARGIETYFLNWTNDEEALRVAARENNISFRQMKEVKESEVEMILQDMAREYKHEESLKLAGGVQASLISSLKQDYDEIHDLGVKWALFYVLVKAEMPSILVETSFISNHKEEKRLSQDEYRDKIAGAIADGVKDYINPPKMAKGLSDKT